MVPCASITKEECQLIGRRDEIILSDFGIALVAQSSRYQHTRDVVGTVAYMAPEQIQGKPRPASDQYSLAVVVYEWLSGARPFSGSFTEVAVQHAVAPPPPLHEKLPSISQDVEQIVLTALAKDPQQRFASVLAFANALEQASLPTQIAVFPFLHQSPAVSPQTTQRNDATGATILPTHHRMTEHTVDATPPGKSQPSKPVISRRTLLIGLAGLTVTGSALTWFVLSRNSVNPLTPHTPTTATPQLNVTEPPSATPSPTPTAANTPTPSSTAVTSPQLGETFTVYRGHTGYIYGVTWASTDGTRVASASLDTSVQVWDANTGQQYYKYNHSIAVNDVKSSPDKTHIASAGEDSVVQVRDARAGTLILTYRNHTKAVNTVEWAPDGNHIVSASRDGTVQVWDATAGSPVYTYRGHTNGVWAADWSPDGRYVVSVSMDGTAQVWDAYSGTTLITYTKHTATVRSVSWSPDSHRIATASEDKTVHVWDASTGNTLLIYRGHTDLMRTVSWSNDSTRIVSGAKDATAQIWDASTGKTIFTYRGHTATVFDAQWSPDGTRIASGSTDTTVKVWQAV